MSTRDHLQRAIQIVGSSSALAKACGVSRTAVWKALRTGRVGPHLAVRIEEATAGRVSRVEFDPALYEGMAHVP